MKCTQIAATILALSTLYPTVKGFVLHLTATATSTSTGAAKHGGLLTKIMMTKQNKKLPMCMNMNMNMNSNYDVTSKSSSISNSNTANSVTTNFVSLFLFLSSATMTTSLATASITTTSNTVTIGESLALSSSQINTSLPKMELDNVPTAGYNYILQTSNTNSYKNYASTMIISDSNNDDESTAATAKNYKVMYMDSDDDESIFMHSKFIFGKFSQKDLKGKETHRYGAFYNPFPFKNQDNTRQELG